MKTWSLGYSRNPDTFYINLYRNSFQDRLKSGIYDIGDIFTHKMCWFIPFPPIPIFHKKSVPGECGKGWHFHNPYKWWGYTLESIGCAYLCQRLWVLLPNTLAVIPITDKHLERLKENKSMAKLIQSFKEEL